ncbi:MAG: ribonuclease HI [Bdellovibrionales bacterium]|nr:ribonuclease HI [Bdellovibrionales bacterium]
MASKKNPKESEENDNDIDFTRALLIFSDGACSGNPGPGGYGTIVVTPKGQVRELGDFDPSTTNNRMEMLGALRGLQEVRGLSGDLWMLTDSTYLIRGITQWIWGWKRKNWKTAEGNEVTNRDLWEALDQELKKRHGLGQISWKYVRGHAGNPGNQRCDEIAVQFSKRKSQSLFDGPLLEYPYAIHDLPEDMSLPPLKNNTEKKKPAYSYLSYVNGVLERHQSWSECESRVKGRSGAKFKKAGSASEEKKIIADWGLKPDSLDNL